MEEKAASENQQHSGERIAKVMARAGLCSRRDAEGWVSAGRVSVNGTVLESPAFNVEASDKILVDGEPLAARERTRLFLFHKPRGTVTTAHDPQGRPTVFDAIGGDLPRVVTVGRLDINTEGLLLLTNDGGLARALELPSTGWLRRYRVRAHGSTNQAVLDGLAAGVRIDGTHYRGIEAKLDRQQGANMWLTIGLREGKNREVKKVLEHIKLKVNRLIRVSYGPFQLGELNEGEIEEIKTRVLKDQLGEKIAAIANPDFDAPVFTAGNVAAAPGPRSGRWERTSEPSHRKPDRDVRPRGKEFSKPDRAKKSDRDFEDDIAPREHKGPGKRKHVSVMRQRAESTGPRARQRVTKTATKDRAGRAVEIETKSPAGRKSSPGSVKPVSERNAKRFSRLTAAPGDRPSPGDRPRRKPADNRPDRSGSAYARTDSDRPRTRSAPGNDRPGRKDGRGSGERREAPSSGRPARSGRDGKAFTSDRSGDRHKDRPGRTSPARKYSPGSSGSGKQRSGERTSSSGDGGSAPAFRSGSARPGSNRPSSARPGARGDSASDRAGSGSRTRPKADGKPASRFSDGKKPFNRNSTGKSRPAGKPGARKPGGNKPSGRPRGGSSKR